MPNRVSPAGAVIVVLVLAELALLVLLVIIGRHKPENPVWRSERGFTDAPPCTVIDQTWVNTAFEAVEPSSMVVEGYYEDDDPQRRCTVTQQGQQSLTPSHVQVSMSCRLAGGPDRPEIIDRMQDRDLDAVFPNGVQVTEDWARPYDYYTKNYYSSVRVGFTLDNLAVTVDYLIDHDDPLRAEVPPANRDRARADTLALARRIAAQLG